MMPPELTVLVLAALVQVVTFVAYAIPANIELGSGYTMSARDREHNASGLDIPRRPHRLCPGVCLWAAPGALDHLGHRLRGNGSYVDRRPVLNFQMAQNPGGVRLRTGAAPPSLPLDRHTA